MNNQNSKTDTLVTGGTGLLGRSICDILTGKGLAYFVSTHGKENLQDNLIYCNLKNGDGLREVLKGKKYILHLASDKKKPDNDIIGTRRLLKTIEILGEKPHLIYISIVGTDQLPLPYFKQKLQTEKVIQESGVDYSILRATQFHEYIDEQLHNLFRLPLITFLPKRVRVQPIDVNIVAERLVDMISRPPTFGIAEIGGRESITLEKAAEVWLKVNNISKLIVDFPLWGTWGKNLNTGVLTTNPQTSVGKTWNEWLLDSNNGCGLKASNKA